MTQNENWLKRGVLVVVAISPSWDLPARELVKFCCKIIKKSSAIVSTKSLSLITPLSQILKQII